MEDINHFAIASRKGEALPEFMKRVADEISALGPAVTILDIGWSMPSDITYTDQFEAVVYFNGTANKGSVSGPMKMQKFPNVYSSSSARSLQLIVKVLNDWAKDNPHAEVYSILPKIRLDAPEENTIEMNIYFTE